MDDEQMERLFGSTQWAPPAIYTLQRQPSARELSLSALAEALSIAGPEPRTWRPSTRQVEFVHTPKPLTKRQKRRLRARPMTSPLPTSTDLDADRALVASDQAASHLAPTGFDHGERKDV